MAKRSIAAAKESTTPRPRVTFDELQGFVEVWQKASSVAEVAKITGWAEAKVRTQATRLRKGGVPLVKFSRPASLTLENVESLRGICEAS